MENKKKITTLTLLKMKQAGEKIAILTCYDFSLARLLDTAGLEVILVGDSAANVIAGYSTTLPITLDQMIYHAQSVVRATRRAMVVVDLPFGTYQGNPDRALTSAVRVMKEAEVQAVKLEGGQEVAPSLKAVLDAGIPVMGHLGLTPQSINQFGSYEVRAKEEAEAGKLLEDAQMLQDLGCFSLVLEKIPSQLAARVAQSLKIPVIGIGAGADVDGQVLVLQDMLGINQEFKPKFVRRYLNLDEEIIRAVEEYLRDVKDSSFPGDNEQYHA